jgi:predicted PurR-regulated permease PerM
VAKKEVEETGPVILPAHVTPPPKPLWNRDIDWIRAALVPVTILAWLAVAVVLFWLLSHVTRTILTIVLAGVIAFALTPLVTAFERRMPRYAAITLAYVLGFGIILSLLALLATTVATQATTLVHELPLYSTRIQGYEPQILRLLRPFHVTHAELKHAQAQVTTYLQSVGTTAAKDSLGIITSILGTIVDFVLVLILSIYLTANGPKIAQLLRSETPDGQERNINRAIAAVNRVVGGYIRGTLTLATLVGVLVGVGMAVLHVPYAALLGVLAFFMEFVPIVGVLVSGAVCVSVAVFQGWQWALIVLAYFVVIHVIEGDVVGPRIMGGAIGIHPATALIALVAGTELFGLWGALFGAPLAGLVQAIVTGAWREIRGGTDVSTVAQAVGRTVEDEVTGEHRTKPLSHP